MAKLENLIPGNYPEEYKIRARIDKAPEYGFSYNDKILLAVDLRRFTETMEESRDPGDMGPFLSKLFDEIAEIIQQLNGSMNKYLGDGFLAHFPVTSARKLPEILDEIIKGLFKIKKVIFPDLCKNYKYNKLGLSIVVSRDSEVIMGRVGSVIYNDYTLLGRNVNQLFRAVDIAKGNQILIFRDLVQFLNKKWILVDLGEQTLDAIHNPVRLYSVMRHREDDENNKLRGCSEKCESFVLCKYMHTLGIGMKAINCHTCKLKKSYACWYKIKCNANNAAAMSCCHICSRFTCCYHSYYLGKFKHGMVWCGVSDKYHYICDSF